MKKSTPIWANDNSIQRSTFRIKLHELSIKADFFSSQINAMTKLWQSIVMTIVRRLMLQCATEFWFGVRPHFTIVLSTHDDYSFDERTLFAAKWLIRRILNGHLWCCCSSVCMQIKKQNVHESGATFTCCLCTIYLHGAFFLSAGPQFPCNVCTWQCAKYMQLQRHYQSKQRGKAARSIAVHRRNVCILFISTTQSMCLNECQIIKCIQFLELQAMILNK